MVPLLRRRLHRCLIRTCSSVGTMILDRFKLTDKVAIVTGAGKGIGAGTARALAEAGADVVCAARTEADIETTAAAIRDVGRRALAVRTDVLERADLEA